MDVKIVNKNFPMKANMEDEIYQLLDKKFGYYNFITKTIVYLERDKKLVKKYTVDIEMRMKNANPIQASDSRERWKMAMNGSIKKIGKQIEKYKNKRYSSG